MAIGEPDPAGAGMEDRQRVHPAMRVGVDDPSAQVVIARISFLDKRQRPRGLRDLRQLLQGRDIPHVAVHPVHLRVAVIGPMGARLAQLETLIGRAMIGSEARAIAPKRALAHSLLHCLHGLVPAHR